MDRSPNWCPNCERETEWLIIPSKPNFVQCKECGYIKKFPRLKAERPKLEKPSVKEKSTVPRPEPVIEISEPWSWHDYLAGIFFLVGLIIELLLCYSLAKFPWGVLKALSPEIQAFYILMFFLAFWAGITQFVIGWLVLALEAKGKVKHIA